MILLHNLYSFVNSAASQALKHLHDNPFSYQLARHATANIKHRAKKIESERALCQRVTFLSNVSEKREEARMTKTSNLGRLTSDLRYVKLSLKKSVPMRY